MKKWTCGVCGYIHTGDEPPETCPVCGADGSKFVEVVEEEAAAPAAAKPQADSPEAPSSAEPRLRKWRCSVCGYIHTGDEPPETCPVCGADRSKFVEVTEDAPDETTPPAPPTPPEAEPAEAPGLKQRLFEGLTDHMVTYHAHPISVHIPNGVLPVAVLFLLISTAFHCESLAQAAFYNLVVVLLAMPFVIFSGYNHWQKKLGGNMTRVILTKLICAGIVLGLTLILVIWWRVEPSVSASSSGDRWLFIFLHLILLGAAGVAGYMGGKLVFKD